MQWHVQGATCIVSTLQTSLRFLVQPQVLPESSAIRQVTFKNNQRRASCSLVLATSLQVKPTKFPLDASTTNKNKMVRGTHLHNVQPDLG